MWECRKHFKIIKESHSSQIMGNVSICVIMKLYPWGYERRTFIAIVARFPCAAGESITEYNESWEIIKTYNAFWTDTRGTRARGHCKINSHAPRVFHYRAHSHTYIYTQVRLSSVVPLFRDWSNFTPIIIQLSIHTLDIPIRYT